MKDKNGGLELWSDGGLEERRPPARRCVRRGHLFGVHALACSGSEQKGNMLKHGHPTVTRPLMKHRTPNFERRTLNCGMGLRVRQENGCSTFGVGCSKLPFRAQNVILACEISAMQHPETSIFRKWLNSRIIPDNSR